MLYRNKFILLEVIWSKILMNIEIDEFRGD